MPLGAVKQGFVLHVGTSQADDAYEYEMQMFQSTAVLAIDWPTPCT
jgi:hypothetical protein